MDVIHSGDYTDTRPKVIEDSTKLSALKGFRHYELGADLSNYPELIRTTIDPDNFELKSYLNNRMDHYINPSEPKKIGDIDIKEAYFSFYDHKLVYITLLFDNSDYRDLKEAYYIRFGGSPGATSWRTEKISLYVREGEKFIDDTLDAQVNYIYRPLSRVMREDFTAGVKAIREERAADL